jgi:hypothetical protein
LQLHQLGFFVNFFAVGGLIAVNFISIPKYSNSRNTDIYISTRAKTNNPSSWLFTFNYLQLGLAAAFFVFCTAFICVM